MRIFGLVTITLTLIFSFQNCSDVSFSSANDPSVVGSGGNDDDGGGGGNPGGEDLPPEDYTPGNSYDLEFKITDTSQVDILFVVDTSGSMEEEHKSIGAAFNGFIASLDGLDWRVAITTMDIYQDSKEQGALGTLVPFVDTNNGSAYQFLDTSFNSIKAQTLFEQTVQRPINCHVAKTNCNYVERGIFNVNLYLDNIKEDSSVSFIRPGSHFNVVFLTDEDVKSLGNDLETYDLPQKLVAKVQQTLNPQSFTAHSIITIPGDSVCKGDEGNYGDIYFELSELTNGLIGNICQMPYTPQLEGIGSTIQSKTNTISLPCYPIPSSLIVEVLPANEAWRLDGNQLIFDAGISNGSTVKVSLTCNANPASINAFSFANTEHENVD